MKKMATKPKNIKKRSLKYYFYMIIVCSLILFPNFCMIKMRLFFSRQKCRKMKETWTKENILKYFSPILYQFLFIQNSNYYKIYRTLKKKDWSNLRLLIREAVNTIYIYYSLSVSDSLNVCSVFVSLSLFFLSLSFSPSLIHSKYEHLKYMIYWLNAYLNPRPSPKNFFHP